MSYLAEEPEHVSQVILAVLTLMYAGENGDVSLEKVWVRISAGDIARRGLMHRSNAAKALQDAVLKGYLLRRKHTHARGYEYTVRLRWTDYGSEESCAQNLCQGDCHLDVVLQCSSAMDIDVVCVAWQQRWRPCSVRSRSYRVQG